MQPGMGGMQPGMGSMQPGSGMGMGAPGGAMQPGVMQPGVMQPGVMQPGVMQPGVMQPGPAGPAGGMGGGGAAPFGVGGMDPFLTGVAGNMLRQQGQSYLQRGQAFMQASQGGWAQGSGRRRCAGCWAVERARAGLRTQHGTSRCLLRGCRPTPAAGAAGAAWSLTLVATPPTPTPHPPLQSKMGFLSGGSLHYHFSITPEYGEPPCCRDPAAWLQCQVFKGWISTCAGSWLMWESRPPLPLLQCALSC